MESVQRQWLYYPLSHSRSLVRALLAHEQLHRHPRANPSHPHACSPALLWRLRLHRHLYLHLHPHPHLPPPPVQYTKTDVLPPKHGSGTLSHSISFSTLLALCKVARRSLPFIAEHVGTLPDPSTTSSLQHAFRMITPAQYWISGGRRGGGEGGWVSFGKGRNVSAQRERRCGWIRGRDMRKEDGFESGRVVTPAAGAAARFLSLSLSLPRPTVATASALKKAPLMLGS